MRRFLTWAVIAAAFSLSGTTVMAQAPGKPDPYAYLEEIEGARALDFARAENARSLPVLQGDRRYQTYYDQALAVATAPDRIPPAGFAGEAVFRGYWQDAEHVRGIWREATRDSYATAQPVWKTLLDLDAVAKAENRNWVWKDVSCLPPEEALCLVELSDGGKDAVSVREFDTRTGQFVTGGFATPEAKQEVRWLDRDTVLIATDWGLGSMTTSGYAYIIKAWTRGTPLASARELYRGKPEDVAAAPAVLRNPDGSVAAVMIERAVSFFETEHYLQTPAGFVRLNLPLKSTLQGLVDGQLVVTLEETWKDTVFKEGDLISLDLAALKAGSPSPPPALILRPSQSQSIDSVATTHGRLVIALYQDVKGALFSYAHSGAGWSSRRIFLPDNISVSISSASDRDDKLLVTTANYLTPTTQLLIDAASGESRLLRALPARFDASTHVTEQFWAASRDGTRVPYFIVRPKDLKMDGTAPTLLYAYGGFQVSQTPAYSGTVGKLWLEHGGVYVVANIRGGGEFGPRWHNAGLKLHRQRVFDDFFAVSQDLITRRITSPRRLGIMGGSNGGLLMGVALTQHPELYHAIVIQVPLFDMLGYTKLGAGASWIGEYGDPDVEEERAYLEVWSPYQNLEANQPYPEVYIDTSTKDDRVHPAHARKAAARLKELGYPYLYYENIDGGHSAAANLNESARRSALEFIYLTQKLMD